LREDFAVGPATTESKVCVGIFSDTNRQPRFGLVSSDCIAKFKIAKTKKMISAEDTDRTLVQ